MANSLDVVSLGTILFLPFFCSHFSKTSVWGVGLAGSVLAQVCVYLGCEGTLACYRPGWMGLRISHQWRCHGHAVFDPLRQC